MNHPWHICNIRQSRLAGILKLLVAASLLLAFSLVTFPLPAEAARQESLVVTAPPQVREGETFTVKVSEKSTEKPVEGAAVYLLDRYEPLGTGAAKKSQDPSIQGTLLGNTDKEGILTVSVKKQGKYFIKAIKENGNAQEGYVPAFTTLTVVATPGGISFYVDKPVYRRGETVTLSLYNGSDETVILSNSAPWVITRPGDQDVFNPVAGTVIVEVKPKETKTWTWDQKDSSGNQARPGVYLARIKTSSGDLWAHFAISGLKHEKQHRNEAPPLPKVKPFKDVTGEVTWGDPQILRLYEKGIVKGVSKDTFDPDGTLTRAQFLALLLRAAGMEPSDTETQDNPELGEPAQLEKPFPDVSPEHWAYRYIVRAKEAGIITDEEYPEGFEPDKPINRLEICVMATRAIGLAKDAEGITGDNLSFRDREEINFRYRGYVQTAVEWGIVNGYDDGTFRPAQNATRREACVIIYRILEDV
ncbi:MAG TPA: hypothetical protein GXX30_00175 [Firmicutes bacterium]|nr:hypothetical protein [Candidatus Fermentithermobacillaceae bacterium]